MGTTHPDSNNVYSTIAAPVDVELAAHVLKKEFPNARVWVNASAYAGVESLHVDSDEAVFDGYPVDGGNPDFLFNGAVAGDDSQVIEKAQSILRSFEEAGFTMSIEAYGSADDLIWKPEL